MLKTNAVFWPFLHWREDGAWGFWPFYVKNLQRESVHQTALWPLITWAEYEKDRDTGGEGYSWMVWPLWAQVRRERERQTMFLPPLFSYAEVYPELRHKTDLDEESCRYFRLRCPWPIFEFEHTADRDRAVIFPLYEKIIDRDYQSRRAEGGVMRFGWRLVEIYRGEDNEICETRVFPFWTKNRNYFRLWPFYESMTYEGKTWSWFFSLFPIKWAEGIDRNWSAFWTFYESESDEQQTKHSLFWGIIRWTTK